jgi:WD40 repeat protein
MYLPTGSVASCSDDGTARIWNVETGICNHILSGHKDKVLNVAYSPASNLFVTGGRDQTVRLWDGASGQCQAVIDDFFGRVNGVAWCGTSDTNSLVTGSFDGSLRLWQVKEEEESCRISLDWSSTSDVLVASSASIQDVEGLSPLNELLLKQCGAVGNPVFRLDEGYKS